MDSPKNLSVPLRVTATAEDVPQLDRVDVAPHDLNKSKRSGPCLKCQLRNWPCSRELGYITPCDVCYWDPGFEEIEYDRDASQCDHPGELTIDLDPAFEKVMQVHHGNWALQFRGTVLRIEFNYAKLGDDVFAKHAMADLDFFIYAKDESEPVKPMDVYDVYYRIPDGERPVKLKACQAFLDQFSTLDRRWGGLYDSLTEEMIAHAAEYQKHISLLDNCPLDQDETWIILLALRCLIASHDLSQLNDMISRDFTTGTIFDQFDDGNFEIYQECKLRNVWRAATYSLDPMVSLSVCDYGEWRYGESPMEDLNPESTMCSLLKRTFNAAESLLLHGRPKDWPTVFYTLYLLQMVHWDLSTCGDWTSAISSITDAVQKALQKLTQLYLLCCGDLHPFSENLDIDWYSLLVGSEEHPIYTEHYSFQHSGWSDYLFDLDDDVPIIECSSEFLKYLDSYTFGFTI
ncbi:hypothetical protein EJ04DRAFT_6053 [Polyplosphaeria fusca]|uniref:Uncharacterized protein n=1 Tax=Polyplosphaeria fusca TaxID=682080 RepID=A0A9P4VAD8_9PLEO|nr:hypothetical protein EJ04DRAFT_6053 [Polyplosphaeria fusca]